jgi:hypothetical protein
MARPTQRKTAGAQRVNGKNGKTPMLSAPRPTTTTADPDESRPQAPRIPDHHEIAKRAFEIYLSRGGWPGKDLEDWLQAERQLRGH